MLQMPESVKCCNATFDRVQCKYLDQGIRTAGILARIRAAAKAAVWLVGLRSVGTALGSTHG